MRLGIFQILEQASQLKTTDEKVEFLRKHNNGSLQMIL
jgi:hypothetical protein